MNYSREDKGIQCAKEDDWTISNDVIYFIDGLYNIIKRQSTKSIRLLEEKISWILHLKLLKTVR